MNWNLQDLSLQEKSKILPGVGFVILLAFLGLVIGTMIGSLFVPKGSGLAGPAIALSYGAIGLAVALLAGILFVRKVSHARLHTSLLAVFVISVLLLSWLFYRARTNVASRAVPAELPKPTAPANEAPEAMLLPKAAYAARQQTQQPLGAGMVKPRLAAGTTLHFYGVRDVTALPDQLMPQDSLTFGQGEHFVEIATAPPWFWPEVMKLDYNLLYLRAKTLSKSWLEVVVNRDTGRTAWVSRHAVDFIHWPDFLLDVFAVELIDPANNPMRIKPLLHASPVALPPRAQLRPLAVQGDWLQVALLGEDGQSGQTGWIRWRKDERLLIRYSLLS